MWNTNKAAGLSTALREVKKEGASGDIWEGANTWKTIPESKDISL